MTRSALDRIRRHGAESYPFECCGALIGDASFVADAFALPNTTDGEPRRRFLVGPNDYQRAEIEAARRGAQLLGFYHSHPDHPARPSQHDLEHAWPAFIHVIVSVRQKFPREITAWRLADDRSRFVEMEVAMDADEPISMQNRSQNA